MKAVILASGRGTSLAEETQVKPKPLVEADSYPLIWHVMQSFFGWQVFVTPAAVERKTADWYGKFMDDANAQQLMPDELSICRKGK